MRAALLHMVVVWVVKEEDGIFSLSFINLLFYCYYNLYLIY